MALDRSNSAIPPARPSMPSASRVCLCPTPPGRRVLDGGWWPRSRDPAVELPKLIAGLNIHGDGLGIVTRVALNPTVWDSAPPRTAIGDRIVPVGWLPTLDVDTIALTTSRHDRITLLVVPPEVTADSAASALALAALEDNTARPSAILAASGISASDPFAASLARHPSRASVPSQTTPAREAAVHPVS
jgi:Family of unknown function (DUF5994)